MDVAYIQFSLVLCTMAFFVHTVRKKQIFDEIATISLFMNKNGSPKFWEKISNLPKDSSDTAYNTVTNRNELYVPFQLLIKELHMFSNIFS